MQTKIRLMRLTPCALLLVGWAISGSACGQVVYNNASTVAESRAKGMSDVISAQGDYNLATSQAAIQAQEATTAAIKNRQLATNTYYEMRRANEAFAAEQRGPKVTMEQAIRFAQAGAPKRLTPQEFDYVTGKIAWPKVLGQKMFDQDRTNLDGVFARRAQLGGVSFEDEMDIRRWTNSMLEELKKQVRDLPSNYYINAKRFIQSLAYEIKLSPTS